MTCLAFVIKLLADIVLFLVLILIDLFVAFFNLDASSAQLPAIFFSLAFLFDELFNCIALI